MSELALADVCLAVASFRNDASVVAMLGKILSSGAHFHSILVVDSLGSGELPELMRRRRPQLEVQYLSYPYNLGSAGNLAARLRHAADSDARFVYTINHDGLVDPKVVAVLAAELRSAPQTGAAYPLRRMTQRGGVFDITGVFPLPFKAFTVKAPPDRRCINVHWSSSNGALYSLEPVRFGLLPWEDLWMGWEDLAYGWLLKANGYRQVIVTDAVVDDAYEHRELRPGIWLTDKPAWYSYYSSRNLILAARRASQSPLMKAAIGGRIALEYGVTLMARREKAKRVAYLSAGIRDGLVGRAGHWKLP